MWAFAVAGTGSPPTSVVRRPNRTETADVPTHTSRRGCRPHSSGSDRLQRRLPGTDTRREVRLLREDQQGGWLHRTAGRRAGTARRGRDQDLPVSQHRLQHPALPQRRQAGQCCCPGASQWRGGLSDPRRELGPPGPTGRRDRGPRQPWRRRTDHPRWGAER
jgi:hypothetical protein